MNEWKCLADMKPAMGQLVEYYCDCTKQSDSSYADVGIGLKKGKFVPDCGTHWTENLAGFTTKKRGVIVAPDPDITYWRTVVQPIEDVRAGGVGTLKLGDPPVSSGPIPPGIKESVDWDKAEHVEIDWDKGTTLGSDFCMPKHGPIADDFGVGHGGIYYPPSDDLQSKDWLCNKCEIGVLDPDKKVRSRKGPQMEAVVICPNCNAENTVWSFNTTDLDIGLGIPEENIKLIAGGVKSLSVIDDLKAKVSKYREALKKIAVHPNFGDGTPNWEDGWEYAAEIARAALKEQK